MAASLRRNHPEINRWLLVSAYQSHEQILILMRPSRRGRIGLVVIGRPPMQSFQIYHVSPL